MTHPQGDEVIEEAAAAASRGALVVLPTDTVYGIGTRPDDPAATSMLFAAKERPAEHLAAACWPGPLTLVLPRTEVSARWELGGDAETIGLRVPAHPLALALLRAAGPLAVTSANRSGDPPARTSDELVAVFGDLVAVYLCQDEPLEGAASTVVDLAHGEARVLREGGLPAEEVHRLLAGEGPAIDSGTPRAGS